LGRFEGQEALARKEEESAGEGARATQAQPSFARQDSRGRLSPNVSSRS